MSSSSSTTSLLINQILSTVRRIFSVKGHHPPPQSVDSVVSLVNQLTLNDLDIRQEDMTFSGTSSLLPLLGRRLPTARVAHIYEDNIISAAIFILRSGQAIPLHDHPGMAGIIRVLSGSVSITSYTPLPEDSPYILPSSISQKVPAHLHKFLIPCRSEGTRVVSNGPDSSCIILYPNEGNIHEVQGDSSQSSVFLDILSPPYNDYRDCHYFTVLGKDKEITWLAPASEPRDYTTTSIPFRLTDRINVQ